ncbi:hypothetical protein NSA47_09160 [Irregularibacter muris]|uniref:ABC transporter permease n=1 Tax=Irregularibacter muris TaxID=1796619 RepID=A0AAE3HEL7_9FIRM|nr:hypothetical protein [Irregularibacter muris]MCR1899151.1 hypothetical protein [Irregularibacter muris]
MKIVLHEIKKVFRLKMIIIVMFMSLILYFLHTSYYIDHFPNGRPALDSYNISLEMLENYGESIDEEEFIHFKKVYEKEIERANQYLQDNKLARETGISTYEEFRSMDLAVESFREFSSYIMFEENVDSFWELQAREDLIRDYEEKEIFIEGISKVSNKQQRQRIDEVVNEGIINSIFPGLILDNYRSYIRQVSLIILLSVIFMLSPIYLRDKTNNINYIQYTSKIGRRLFKKKAVAAIIASFIIITLQLIVFFLLYATNHTGMFLNSNIISIFSKTIFWYNLTFTQYIILTVMGIYALGFIIALTVSFISSLAPNYITMIAIQIPLVFFTSKVLIIHLIHSLADISLPKYSRGIAYLGLIMLSLILNIIRWKREKVVDIA